MIDIDKNSQAAQSLVDGVQYYVNKKLTKLPYNVTERGRIISIDSNGNYNIKINNSEYNGVRTSGGTCEINELVNVEIPKNNYNYMYINKPFENSSSITGVSSVNGKTGAVTVTEDRNYTHTQEVASDEWIINHDLNKYPSIDVVDENGNIIWGEIQYLSLNSLKIVFSIDSKGKAFFN